LEYSDDEVEAEMKRKQKETKKKRKRTRGGKQIQPHQDSSNKPSEKQHQQQQHIPQQPHPMQQAYPYYPQSYPNTTTSFSYPYSNPPQAQPFHSQSVVQPPPPPGLQQAFQVVDFFSTPPQINPDPK
jgi:hypothetical protein